MSDHQNSLSHELNLGLKLSIVVSGFFTGLSCAIPEICTSTHFLHRLKKSSGLAHENAHASLPIPTTDYQPVPSNLQSPSGFYQSGIHCRIGLLQSAYFNRFAAII